MPDQALLFQSLFLFLNGRLITNSTRLFERIGWTYHYVGIVLMALIFFSLPTSGNAQVESADTSYIQEIDTLLIMGEVYLKKNAWAEADSIFSIAEMKTVAHLGKASATYSDVCYFQGLFHDRIHEMDEAISKYQVSLDLREQLFGHVHPKVGDCLLRLAIVHEGIGRFDQAEKYYLECRDVRAKTVGVEHADYGGVLSDMAVLYQIQGNYTTARSYYDEAQPILEKALGSSHPRYGMLTFNRANLSRYMGEYEAAESGYSRAAEIFALAMGHSNSYYAMCVSSQGDLLKEMGIFKEAESKISEGIDIWEQVLGSDHPYMATSLVRLAILYNETGRYPEADSLLGKVFRIRKSTLGEDHPEYAAALATQAAFLHTRGEQTGIEELYLKTLEIQRSSLGDDHMETIRTGLSLSQLYHEQQRYPESLTWGRQVVEKWSGIYGLFHPDIGLAWGNLARIYREMGDVDSAVDAFIQRAEQDRKQLLGGIHHLSERELSEYMTLIRANQDEQISYTRNHHPDHPVLSEAVYDNILFYKGFLQRSVQEVRRQASRHPTAANLYQQYQVVQRNLTQEYMMPTHERDSSSILKLELEANQLEKDMARSVSGLNEMMSPIRWKAVRDQLEPQQAAIEFIRYLDEGAYYYAALLVLPECTAPQFISLTRESDLAQLITKSTERRGDYVNDLYTYGERGLQPDQEQLPSLMDQIWTPIQEHIPPKTKSIYFAPDGLLHRINLQALPLDEIEVLNDRYHLFEMTSTRQLLASDHRSSTSERNAAIFGGISFDPDPICVSPTGFTPVEEAELASRGSSTLGPDSILRGGSWKSLIWTQKEGDAILQSLTDANYSAIYLNQEAASEGAFKDLGSFALASPRILHVATHGFFFPDPDVVNEEGQAIIYQQSEDPMFRSGLILAGGNYAWQTGLPVSAGMEDGILSAYEISQLDLGATELVVLSACETGLGDIEGNEGVYGLQRAFQIAGAKYLIMSLWQVPDRETMQFMTTFYRNWLEEKGTIPEAFRKTQREMRDRFFNPYSWAGFVLVE